MKHEGAFIEHEGPNVNVTVFNRMARAIEIEPTLL
jgi:hypothetical protein